MPAQESAISHRSGAHVPCSSRSLSPRAHVIRSHRCRMELLKVATCLPCAGGASLQGRVLGLFLIAVTSVIWVASSFVSQLLVGVQPGAQSYHVPPFVLTWASTSLFTLFLPAAYGYDRLQRWRATRWAAWRRVSGRGALAWGSIRCARAGASTGGWPPTTAPRSRAPPRRGQSAESAILQLTARSSMAPTWQLRTRSAGERPCGCVVCGHFPTACLACAAPACAAVLPWMMAAEPGQSHTVSPHPAGVVAELWAVVHGPVCLQRQPVAHERDQQHHPEQHEQPVHLCVQHALPEGAICSVQAAGHWSVHGG